MRRHPSFHHKSAAIFLSLFLTLFNGLSYATPLPPSLRDSIPDKAGARLAISIPEELGRIEESLIGKSDKTVIYLQDAHDSFEAQENIAKLIHYFVEKYGVKTVFEEGYEGPVPTDEYFGFIKDPEIKEKVSYFLMDKLRIGGAEYAHINRKKSAKQRGGSAENSGGDFKLIGADSIKLHLENIEWYRKNAQHQEETDKDLKALSTEITKLANRYFPKELKEWIKLKKRFDEKQLPLLDYLKRVMSLRPASPVKGPRFARPPVPMPSRWEGIGTGTAPVPPGKPGAPSAVVDFSRHPNINLLLQAENTHDKEILEKVKTLEAKALFEEIDSLENDFAKQFLSTERDRQIFQYHKALDLLKRLNAIEITPAEYEALKKTLQSLNTQALAQFIVEQTKKSIVLSRKWEENIQKVVSFYETSRVRDEAIEKALETFVIASEAKQSQDIALLVFGGFHKERIKEILQKRGYSFLVISPKITQIDPRHQGYYRRLMSVGYHPFETPFNVTQAAKTQPVYSLPNGRAEVRAVYKGMLRLGDKPIPILFSELEGEISNIAQIASLSPRRAEVRTSTPFMMPVGQFDDLWFDKGIQYLKSERISQPETFIANKFREYQIVGLGERHNLPALQKFIAALIPRLFQNGVRYLVLELKVKDQTTIDAYLKTGEETAELRQILADYPSGYAEILRLARNYYPDLRVIASDSRTDEGDFKYIDRGVALEIRNILSKDPRAKIFVYFGAAHLARQSRSRYATLGALLNPLTRNGAYLIDGSFTRLRQASQLQTADEVLTVAEKAILKAELMGEDFIVELRKPSLFDKVPRLGNLLGESSFGNISPNDSVAWLGNNFDAFLYLGGSKYWRAEVRMNEQERAFYQQLGLKVIRFSEADEKTDATKYGNKGRNLVLMDKAGMPVPEGAIIPSDEIRNLKKDPKLLKQVLSQHGNTRLPFVVYVRSSPPASMPGAMTTVPDVKTFGQLRQAINTVINSWNSPEAIAFRKANNIADDVFPAIVIQKKVDGTKSQDTSGSGVFFTRDSDTGEKILKGRFAWGKPGEAVVQSFPGYTPDPLESLFQKFSNLKEEVEQIARKLEVIFLRPQEVEFVVEEGKLWIVQSRDAKLTPQAEVKTSLDMANEGIINKLNPAVRIIDAQTAAQTHTLYKLKESLEYQVLAQGIGASPGAVQTKVTTDLEKAETEGLVYYADKPSDELIVALIERKIPGLITAYGHEMTHEAITARGGGAPYVAAVGNVNLPEDLLLIIDGATGSILTTSDLHPLIQDKRVLDQTFGIDVNEIKKEIETQYPHTLAVLGYSFRRLFSLLVEHALLLERAMHAGQITKQELEKNLRAHFIHGRLYNLLREGVNKEEYPGGEDLLRKQIQLGFDSVLKNLSQNGLVDLAVDNAIWSRTGLKIDEIIDGLGQLGITVNRWQQPIGRTGRNPADIRFRVPLAQAVTARQWLIDRIKEKSIGNENFRFLRVDGWTVLFESDSIENDVLEKPSGPTPSIEEEEIVALMRKITIGPGYFIDHYESEARSLHDVLKIEAQKIIQELDRAGMQAKLGTIEATPHPYTGADGWHYTQGFAGGAVEGFVTLIVKKTDAEKAGETIKNVVRSEVRGGMRKEEILTFFQGMNPKELIQIEVASFNDSRNPEKQTGEPSTLEIEFRAFKLSETTSDEYELEYVVPGKTQVWRNFFSFEGTGGVRILKAFKIRRDSSGRAISKSGQPTPGFLQDKPQDQDFQHIPPKVIVWDQEKLRRERLRGFAIRFRENTLLGYIRVELFAPDEISKPKLYATGIVPSSFFWQIKKNLDGFAKNVNKPLLGSSFADLFKDELKKLEAKINETNPRAEVRELPTVVLPNFNVHSSFGNLQGRFTVFADLDDVANLTDRQLTEDYEKIAIRHKNVSFVFYNDQKVIRSAVRNRLEKLQEQLGTHRIQITQDNAQSVFTRQWVGELIHVSKSRPSPEIASPRREDGGARNDGGPKQRLHRFRYLGDETGVVPVALLYVNQGNKGFENKVIDLSMVDERLIAQVLAYQASLVFARSA